MEPTNPYQAPTASVATASEQSDLQLRPARRVSAGRGGSWLSFGFSSVGQSVTGWTLVFIVLALCYFGLFALGQLLSSIHFIVGLLPPLMFYPFATILWGGVMVACHDGPLTFKKVLKGVQNRQGPLLMLGVLSIVISTVVFLPVFLFAGLGTAMLDSTTSANLISPLWIVVIFLVSLFVFGLYMAAIWFSPALVAVGNVSPLSAIKRSFTACFKNFLPFTVFSLICVVLSIASLLLLGLIGAIVGGVLGLVLRLDDVGNAVGFSGLIFAGLLYVAVLFLIVSVTGAAQYASFKDIFAYDEVG